MVTGRISRPPNWSMAGPTRVTSCSTRRTNSRSASPSSSAGVAPSVITRSGTDPPRQKMRVVSSVRQEAVPRRSSNPER